MVVLKEVEAMGCEDIKSRVIKNKEETMGVAMKETEIITVEDVRAWILRTVASAADVVKAQAIGTVLRKEDAMAGKGDRPHMIWKVEEGIVADVVTSNVVDATLPPRGRGPFSSRPRQRTRVSLASRYWKPLCRFVVSNNRFRGNRGETTRTVMYVCALLNQLQGVYLSLGKAPIWDGGSSRPGKEFATICGFSAALGPLLLECALDAVYGKKFFPTVVSLPPMHVMYMYLVYWQRKNAPFDASERFFRMVANPKNGTITTVKFSKIKYSTGWNSTV